MYARDYRQKAKKRVAILYRNEGAEAFRAALIRTFGGPLRNANFGGEAVAHMIAGLRVDINGGMMQQ